MRLTGALCLFVLPRPSAIAVAEGPGAPVATYGTIDIDGNLADWTPLAGPDPAPWQSPAGYELYGTYDAGTGTYLLAIKTDGTAIESGTTVWPNTDQNPRTGYLIWDWAVGAEYNVNFYTDSQPQVHTGADG